jgi:sulfur-oxidizing protein SoxX
MGIFSAIALSGFVVVGDGIPQALTATPGDAVRGRAIVVNRQQGLCLLCHSGPFADVREQGNLASNLQGAGTRGTAAQLRLRVADARRLDPDGLMPSLHRVPPADIAQRVGAAWRSKPVLDAQQVEDVVAFLQTLQ